MGTQVMEIIPYSNICLMYEQVEDHLIKKYLGARSFVSFDSKYPHDDAIIIASLVDVLQREGKFILNPEQADLLSKENL